MTRLEIAGLACLIFVVWFTWYEASKKSQGDGQTKRMSLLEAWANIFIGFALNFACNFWIIPEMTDGATLKAANNFWGGAIFTAVSMLRQYTIRRFFNTHIHRFAVWCVTRFA